MSFAVPSAVHRESRLAAKYATVSGLGFLTDATVLHIALSAGLEPAWARVISLACAMNVTFVVNGVFVFRCLTRANAPRHWVSYMATNAFGNLCNYFIFLAFVSSRLPVIGVPLFAIGVGSLCAWVINYLTTRFLVFGKALGALGVRGAEETICGDDAARDVRGDQPAPSTSLT